MCHLRGLLMLRLNRTDVAKENLMEALSLDVKCYDAFELLVGGEMMGIDEGKPPNMREGASRSRSVVHRMGVYPRSPI